MNIIELARGWWADFKKNLRIKEMKKAGIISIQV